MKEPSEKKINVLCVLSIIFMVIHYVLVIIAIFMDVGNNLQQDQRDNKIQEIFHEIIQEGTLCLALEIIAVVLFLAAVLSFKRSHERYIQNMLAQVFSLLTAMPLVYYLKQFFEWLPESWANIWQYCSEHRKIIAFYVILFAFILIDMFLVKHRNKSKEFSLFGNEDPYLNYSFLCLIILHEIRLLLNYAGIEGFITVVGMPSTQERITLTFFTLFLLVLIAVLIHCKRKEGHLSLIMWINIGVCIWGMVPVLYSIGEKEGILHKYSIYIIMLFIMAVFILEKLIDAFGGSDFAAAVHIILQILALLAAILVVLLLLTVLVKAIRNLPHFHIRDTEVWKEYMKDMKKGHRIFLYGYIAACLLVLCIMLIFFLQRFHLSQQKSGDLSEVLPQIIIMIALAVVFAIAVVFVLCQIGIYIVRTIKEIESMEQEKKSNIYIYGIHGISAFFTLILSIISWYIYAKIDFTEETAIGVAGDVFRYFAFPVIALLWYAIMYYLLSVILNNNDKRAKKLKKKIKKNAYKLAGDFVDGIFAPFRLFCNFFVELFKSMKK